MDRWQDRDDRAIAAYERETALIEASIDVLNDASEVARGWELVDSLLLQKLRAIIEQYDKQP